MADPLRFVRNRAVIATTSVFVGAAIAGPIAYAAIPNSNTKVISACYSKTSGALRVIDKQSGKTCTTSEKLIEWNQKGPKAVLYHQVQEVQGPLPRSFTFTGVPAGRTEVRVEGSG